MEEFDCEIDIVNVKVDVLMTNNVVQCLGAMLDTIVFK